MLVTKSPENIRLDTTKYIALFLAGGISNCPDWQSYIVDQFQSKYEKDNLVIINPRRKGDLTKDGSEAKDQILWEHFYLERASHILFWFPEETLCPITLFELGKYCELHYSDIEEHITIGIHPNYKRRFDIETQIPLMDKEVQFVYDLDSLVERVAKKLNLKEK